MLNALLKTTKLLANVLLVILETPLKDVVHPQISVTPTHAELMLFANLTVEIRFVTVLKE